MYNIIDLWVLAYFKSSTDKPVYVKRVLFDKEIAFFFV